MKLGALRHHPRPSCHFLTKLDKFTDLPGASATAALIRIPPIANRLPRFSTLEWDFGISQSE